MTGEREMREPGAEKTPDGNGPAHGDLDERLDGTDDVLAADERINKEMADEGLASEDISDEDIDLKNRSLTQTLGSVTLDEQQFLNAAKRPRNEDNLR